MLTINPFDGTIDSDDHLNIYKEQMYVEDVDDVTCCCYFPAMLKGSHRSGTMVFLISIASFLQLVELLSTHFRASKSEWKIIIHLAKIRQA